MTQAVSVIRSPRARELQGKRAGFASRVTADLIDYAVVVGIYLAILLGIALAEYFLGSKGFDVPDPSAATSLAAQWVIGVLYLTASWAGGGRSIGKTVLGLRVVTTDAKPVPPGRAFVRALICATVGAFTLLWVLVSRRRAAAHDIVVRTTVVYDWSHGS